jgi:hypothetical protein
MSTEIVVSNDIININVTEETIIIESPSGAYPLPNNVYTVFGRIGNVIATEGDYSLTQLSDVTLTSPANGQVLKYNGTAWVNDTVNNTVTSVFGRTNNVVATSGDYTTTLVTEGSNLYFTNLRAQSAISLTTIGTSGAATYSSGVLNIPNYGSALSSYVPYSGATNDLNLGTHNLFANNFFDGFTNVAASGTQIVLTIASTPSYTITGSGGQTIKLPDATTLPNGAIYSFNNNQSSGAINVNNNSNTLIVSIPSGGYAQVVLLDNSISAGSWDRHFQAPANVSWSTNTLDYAGSITSATWNGATIQPNRGGTGQSTYTDGQLLIGNTTGNTLTKANLSAGTGISITNGGGSISIASTITQYTDALARASISFVAGSGAYNSTTGVITIPTNNTQITNGANYITLTSLSASTGISYNNTTGVITSTITQYTNALARASISLTTTGTSGAATYSSSTGVLNIPQYSGGSGMVYPAAGIALSTGTAWGTSITDNSANWDTAYTNRITSLTTTGASGSATLVSNVLNIPTYTLSGLGGISLSSLSATSPLFYNNTTGVFTIQVANTTQSGYLSSTDWNIFNGKGSGTVTSVAALTLGTTGTDLSSSVATGTTTPVITLNVPTASAANRGALSSADWSTFNGKESVLTFSSPLVRTTNTISIPVATTSVNGYLSSADWTTFNGKQGAITLTTTGTSGAATLVGNTLNIPQYAGSGGTPGGADTQIQFNNASAFGGSANFTWNTTTNKLTIGGSQTASAGIAQSTIIQPTLVAAANSDVLTGLYINPTFTNGAFTGVTNNGLIVAAGNIGLGTTTIGSKLQVNGNTAIGYSASTVAPTNGLKVAGVGIFDSNLGLGVTPSTWNLGKALQIGTTTSFFNDAAGNSYLGNNFYYNSAFLYSTTANAVNYVLTTTGEHRWNTAPSGTAGNAITFTQAMTLNASGNLGLGTTTIGSRLQINGNAAIGYSASTAAPTNGLSVSGTTNIGTNTSVTTALLQVSSTTQGFLPPVMTTTQKNAITSPATGLVVFDSTLGKLCVFSSTWQTITSV